MADRIGPWDVYGATRDELDTCRATSRRSTYPWARLLERVPIVLRFRARADMPQVPGSQIHSEGYAPRAGEIWVAHGLPRQRAIYVVLHESAHLIPLSSRQMLDVMLLLEPTPNRIENLPRTGPLTADQRRVVRDTWVGDDYLWRPREAFPDDHVQAFTDPRLVSPFEGWYRRDTPRHRERSLREVCLRGLRGEPVGDDVPNQPDPLPDPVIPGSPSYAELLELSESLEGQLDTCRVEAAELQAQVIACELRADAAIRQLRPDSSEGEQVTDERVTRTERADERTTTEQPKGDEVVTSTEQVEVVDEVTTEQPADTADKAGPDASDEATTPPK